MPHIHADTPRETYTIAGEQFDIPMPYTEGHQLTAGEASQLNQVFAENIRNNLASKVSSAKEADSFDAVEFQRTVDEYALAYQMGVRTGGGGRVSDPVQAKALDIAKDLVRDALRKAGIQISAVTAAQITERAKKAIADNPSITDLARKQVEDTKSIAAVVLDSLPVGEDSEGETEASPSRKGKKAA